jgi:hypothetical protein
MKELPYDYARCGNFRSGCTRADVCMRSIPTRVDRPIPYAAFYVKGEVCQNFIPMEGLNEPRQRDQAR